ncbi:cell wall anchor protein [Nocardioides sp. dk4132]|uniref:prenyltransferase/squalene oxidase repeat-containing protein n=1 Tax=unclassified Nocardioides TaxID=2615069 RepID=UPI00129513A7|nr:MULTISPECIES: prenyltransferase/squalene oxidase repeat-containing protein [unclassified Nocardioides]MQW77785.1 cell wall anchor protein [Nocardioides sp. dk4132]QGA07034.1 cell wall anchor protein [Nocardioides sp. dk884]
MSENSAAPCRRAPLRRVRALAVLGSLVLVTSACGGDTEDASPEPAPERATAPALGAAHWLSEELQDGLLVGEYGPDYGLSIDAALGLADVPGQDDTVHEIAAAVGASVESYTTGVDFGSPDTFAGSVAKVAVLAEVSGGDPRDVDGTDVLARLEDLVADDGALAGRLADDVRDPKGSDYANAIGQTYAVRALTGAGSPEASAAADYLIAQQCEPGWFRLYFAAPDAPQACGDGPRRLDQPDTDVTALAVLALQDVPGEAAGSAVDAAVDWLVATQDADGGFGGATGTEGLNANSTGLAGLALQRAGRTAEAARAAEWVAARQVTEPSCGATRLPTGAVAYAADAAAGELRDPVVRDQWRRATAQAAPLLQLVGEPAGEVVATASEDEVRIDGLGDGEPACLTGPGGYAEELVGTGDTLEVPLAGTVPAGLEVRTLTGAIPVDPAV